MSSSLLSLAIWVPIIGALVVFAAGNEKTLSRWMALIVAVAGFLVTIPLYMGFDSAQAGMQFAPFLKRQTVIENFARQALLEIVA